MNADSAKAQCAALHYFHLAANGTHAEQAGEETDSYSLHEAMLNLVSYQCWDYHEAVEYYVRVLHGMGTITLFVWEMDQPETRTDENALCVVDTGYDTN